MRMRALTLCADEKILRVLRRVLADVDVELDHAADPEHAIGKLTRWRFEAVIVDFSAPRAAEQFLRGVRRAPSYRRAILVALLDPQNGTKAAAELGLHFVLYKPLTIERAKSSFRAVRALMKIERRRAERLPLEIPVFCTLGEDPNGPARELRSFDVGEGGIALRVKDDPDAVTGKVHLRFQLPGSGTVLGIPGEVAWKNERGIAGLRFMQVSLEQRDVLRDWIRTRTGEAGRDDDAAMPCRLTDLTPGGCYLATQTPLPLATRVVLRMQSGAATVRVAGNVRCTHPETGMGLDFLQSTPAQKRDVENLIEALCSNPGQVPELTVEPEGIESDLAPLNPAGDPLLQLFSDHERFSSEEFQLELSRQRSQPQDEVAGF
jgi:hypothetical protein